jgi:hypothetical protein
MYRCSLSARLRAAAKRQVHAFESQVEQRPQSVGEVLVLLQQGSREVRVATLGEDGVEQLDPLIRQSPHVRS